MHTNTMLLTVTAWLVFAGYACVPEPEDTTSLGEPTKEQVEVELEDFAKTGRLSVSELDFDSFKEGIYREPFEGGKFLVNGDTTIVDEKHLREFFENEIQTHPQRSREELIVHQVGGLDAVWNREQKLSLTYCVSSVFGDRYQSVLDDMAAAADAWEEAANVDLIHESSEDGDCNAANSNVVFDVRPVDVGGQYLARAFFPNEPRFARNVLIDESAFELEPNDALKLVGILRHELGHSLGFRHEHTRPESGTCFEDADWRPVTNYDALSVMHYPQCNGLGDWTLTLTAMDENGAACLYEAALGFEIDSTICAPKVVNPILPDASRTETFTRQSVALDEWKEYGPFDVAPGSLLKASMGGVAADGDPDLYVRFNSKPRRTAYDCRPFLLGVQESCDIDVPANATHAWIKVHGYAAGSYDLEVTYQSVSSDALTTEAPPIESDVMVRLEPEEANRRLRSLSMEGRLSRSELDFEAFKETVYQEPGGKFIVNGDTTIVDEKHLREFFENKIQLQPNLDELVVAVAAGLDSMWNQTEKLALTYCVSDTFGDRHAAVVSQMESAAGVWEAVANLDFIYESSQDSACTATNSQVVFDVRPVSFDEYLARAFFPNEPRPMRNVLIDDSSFELDPGGNLTLAGILRHELGHTLGFRHEHTRPESGACFEDNDWRVITDYDALSVMHYPQCNGRGDWSLRLTARDQNGAACLYDEAPSFNIDQSICIPEDHGNLPAEPPKTETRSGQSVAAAAWKEYGPFDVAAGTVFEAKIGGEGASGDPDLYVRFNHPPRANAYDCRPYLVGAEESCSIDVPSNATKAWIKVNGYETGTYDLTVTHAPPST